MRQHLTWPHFHPPRRRVDSAGAAPRARSNDPQSRDERWQVLKDKLAVAAVLLLVLATLTVFVLYVVQQAPHFRSGELTGFATPAPGMMQPASADALNSDATGPVAGSGLGRIPLILISTIVEMGIFVALGLYLRHDMKRKP
ncbi:MAG: hypothetical protein ACM30E_07060 [Nitrososphaerales archaeon]